MTSLRYVDYATLLRDCKPPTKVTKHIDRLGLMPDRVGKRGNVTFRKLGKPVEELANAVSKKVDELCETFQAREMDERLANSNVRSSIVQPLSEQFGMIIWGSTRAYVKGPLDNEYPKDLFYNEPEGKEEIEYRLLCWIVTRVYSKLARTPARRPDNLLLHSPVLSVGCNESPSSASAYNEKNVQVPEAIMYDRTKSTHRMHVTLSRTDTFNALPKDPSLNVDTLEHSTRETEADVETDMTEDLSGGNDQDSDFDPNGVCENRKRKSTGKERLSKIVKFTIPGGFGKVRTTRPYPYTGRQDRQGLEENVNNSNEDTYGTSVSTDSVRNMSFISCTNGNHQEGAQYQQSATKIRDGHQNLSLSDSLVTGNNPQRSFDDSNPDVIFSPTRSALPSDSVGLEDEAIPQTRQTPKVTSNAGNGPDEDDGHFEYREVENQTQLLLIRLYNRPAMIRDQELLIDKLHALWGMSTMRLKSEFGDDYVSHQKTFEEWTLLIRNVVNFRKQSGYLGRTGDEFVAYCDNFKDLSKWFKVVEAHLVLRSCLPRKSILTELGSGEIGHKRLAHALHRLTRMKENLNEEQFARILYLFNQDILVWFE